MKSIGFIGLGAMGKPMAGNLIKAGYPLYVYDINQHAVKALEDAGAVSCESPEIMAKCVDVVITMLGNAQIVKSVLTEENGFLKGCRAGQIVIDMSTVGPDSAVRMAKIVNGMSLEYVDAPVSGGVTGAANATLTIMIGGVKETVDEVMPILGAMGKNLYRIGDVGSGDAIKLVNNMLLGINMTAVAEALVLGVKLGLDPQTMCDVIKVSSGRSFAFEAKALNFILPGKFAPGFSVDLQYKDLGLAIDAAEQFGVPAPMTALSRQIFEMARAKRLNREDISSVIKIWEEMTGVSVRA